MCAGELEMHLPLNAECSKSPWGPWNYLLRSSGFQGAIQPALRCLWGVLEYLSSVTPWEWVPAAGSHPTVCTGHCRPEPPCGSAPSAGHRYSFFWHEAAQKWLNWHYSPVLCCAQIRGRGWIKSCGGVTPDFPAAHLGSEQSTDSKLQRK